jgi:wyosine [tRNA(Phe)-imidazoG37] synthetase (radical SAM superfamily)
MLIKDMNDTYELLNIQKALSEINPDEVHLNTVVRPPAEIYAEPIRYAELLFAKRILGENAQVIHPFHRKKAMKGKDTNESIMEMVKRRPLTITDIANVLGISSLNAQKMIDKLKKEGRLKEKTYKGKEYYSFQLQEKI